MPRPPDLPDFDNPPLVEVVLSVQFSDLQSYRTVHPGLLWERKFRESFPEFAEQPPLDPLFETLAPSRLHGQGSPFKNCQDRPFLASGF